MTSPKGREGGRVVPSTHRTCIAQTICQVGVPVGTAGGVSHGLCPAQLCGWWECGTCALKAALSHLPLCTGVHLQWLSVSELSEQDREPAQVSSAVCGTEPDSLHRSLCFRQAALLHSKGQGDLRTSGRLADSRTLQGSLVEVRSGLFYCKINNELLRNSIEAGANLLLPPKSLPGKWKEFCKFSISEIWEERSWRRITDLLYCLCFPEVLESFKLSIKYLLVKRNYAESISLTLLILCNNLAWTNLQHMQSLQTISIVHTDIDFWQEVSAFFVSILSFLGRFIDLNTSELFIIGFFFPFISSASNLWFLKYECKWVLPFISLLSCHSGPEAGRGSAVLLRVLLMCDWRWKILVTGRGSLFPFCCCCCCMKCYRSEIRRK